MAKHKQVDDFIKAAAYTSDLQKVRSQKRYDELRGRRGAEKELWQKWDANGRQKEDLQPLLKSFDPMINSETKKRLQGLGGSISQSALKNELRISAVKAFHSYKPEKAQLSTHVMTNFQRVTDFVAGARNQLYMPRPDVERYQKFTSARDQFLEEHGREPTHIELQQQLPSLSVRQIRRLAKGFSPEAYSSMGTEFDEAAPKVDVRDAYLLVRPQLNEKQKSFAELHYPPAGEQQLTVAAIAKQLGMPPHRAYQIKSEVERRLAAVLKKE